MIESNFENERKELEHSEYQVEDLERRIGALTVAPGSLELQQLEQLEGRGASKVEELECPVCFTTCSQPIYTCPNQHLVCSTCRPHLSTCPECRVDYGGHMKVHRYAERDARELQEIQNELTRLRARSPSREKAEATGRKA